MSSYDALSDRAMLIKIKKQLDEQDSRSLKVCTAAVGYSISFWLGV